MPHSIVILGGGISGLATAWFLKQKGHHCLIVEKQFKPGGWIQTLRSNEGLFELGPKSYRSRGGEETISLIESLGLQTQLLLPSLDSSRRYLYHKQRLCSMPNHLWQIPFSPLTKGWVKVFLKHLYLSLSDSNVDETIYDFFEKRLGKTWTDQLIDPFVLGIFGGNARHLSLKSCFPQIDRFYRECKSPLFNLLRLKHSSAHLSDFQKFIINSYPIFSFQDGMQALPLALASELNDHCCLGQEVCQLDFREQDVVIKLKSEQTLYANYVISTLPAFSLSSILKNYPSLSCKLNQLNYASISCIHLSFTRDFPKLKGFGYLVPSQVGSIILGCTWDSSVFARSSSPFPTQMTFMIKGCHQNDETLIQTAKKALQEQMNIHDEPAIIQIKRAENAIPQYEVGYSIWKEELNCELSRITQRMALSGSAFSGISINDCIKHAKKLVHHIPLTSYSP